MGVLSLLEKYRDHKATVFPGDEKMRCKEVWVKDADRFRNPDQDLPEDFDARREEYYAAIEQPRDPKVFVETVSTYL